MLYDLIIIGGGPAGCASAVYAARKKIKTLLITESFGGQSIVSDDIQNWIGQTHISGADLAKKLEEHVRSFTEIEIKISERAVKIAKENCNKETGICYPPEIYDFEVETDKGGYSTKTVLLALGSRHKKLGIPGEEEFTGKGVAWCSTCDAPLFADKDVAVIGGGNSGLEAAVDLFPYARKIYILEYGEMLKGDQVTQDIVRKNPKSEIILGAQAKQIIGSKFVEGLVYLDRKTSKENKLTVGGVFVEIGTVPNSEPVKDLVECDKYGQVVTDSRYGSTSCPGIFAAGDITDSPFKQNNIAAGDAIKAMLSAYDYLKRK